MLSVSAILPTYNERDNIADLIAAIFRLAPQVTEIIVVDDDSPDGTWAVVAELAKADPRVQLLRRIGERGLTSALKAGFAQATGDAVLWMDCDFSMPPQVIPSLLRELEEADVVLGSRYVRGGKDVGHSWSARLFSRLINLFAALLLGFAIHDYTSGFVVARREVLQSLPLRGDYGEYCIDFLYRAWRKGYRVKEVPYTCLPRRAGESKTATHIGQLLWKGRKYVTTILGLRLGYEGKG